MQARLKKLLNDIAETFWLLPGALVVSGVVLGWALVEAERDGLTPDWLDRFVYGGGESGARAVLGAIASSSIAVAGTIFSITIATLTLASTQMGPRLLHNFTRDVNNQVTLGTLLGTFAYSLVVLRTVQGVDDATFVPHLALTVGVGFALACIGVLVLFVHHVASRINVDTVIELVHRDLMEGLGNLDRLDGAPDAPDPRAGAFAGDGAPVRADRDGYLAQLDETTLSRWAARNDATVELLVRPGQYVFAGTAVARVRPAGQDAEKAVRSALVMGSRAGAAGGFEFAIRQLVEVAVRALSPGVNDPITANQVLDRLGSALCMLSERALPAPVVCTEDRPSLLRAVVTYPELVGAMFDMIRQNARGQPAVLTRLVEVLAKAAECEVERGRVSALAKEAALTVAEARRSDADPADLAQLEKAYEAFRAAIRAATPEAQEHQTGAGVTLPEWTAMEAPADGSGPRLHRAVGEAS